MNLFTAFDTCNYFEPSIGRCVEDGVGGARSDLSPAPSVDIANGAPNGADATNRIVMSWVDGRAGLNHEQVMFSTSGAGGTSFTTPAAVQQGADRGYYSAPAISPDGKHVWLVYNAFTTPFRTSAVGPGNDRELDRGRPPRAATSAGVGRVHAPSTAARRATPAARRRTTWPPSSSATTSTPRRRGPTARRVWNDMRRGADCPAVDAYRQALHDEAVATGTQTAEAEEPRGADAGRRAARAGRPPPQPPDVAAALPGARSATRTSSAGASRTR